MHPMKKGHYVARPKKSPRDANAALVTWGRIHGTCKITSHLKIAINVSREMTSYPEIEREIIANNRRHLQQTEQEKGITQDPLMREIHANYGVNPSSQAILAGA